MNSSAQSKPCADMGTHIPCSPQEYEADIAFLLARSMAAGSCDFTSERWTGMSSNALAAVAYGGEQNAMPFDRSDYAACVRTYKRLPKHRKTAAVRAALWAAKEHYLARYPQERSAEYRAQQQREYEKRREAEAQRRARNWKRRQARAARDMGSRVAAPVEPQPREEISPSTQGRGVNKP